ncbi:hypothetical protein SAMN05421736_107120 [Evansella caseinilytica]|uniref:Uncharacterized protein n=1 Tax=Evansella caseinilytica TaxID=1503961 RepID=A0A1H3QZE3_9BACI|nr:hypothetical protein SAMN05421736_107120 [Evansella caseinilytica]
MAFFKNLDKSQKLEYSIVFSIFAISIIVGNVIGQNSEWFRSSNSTGGYMAGSLLTCLVLFSVYRSIAFIVHLFRKKSVQ